MADEVSREGVFILEQQGAQFVDVPEGAATREFAAGIDRRAEAHLHAIPEGRGFTDDLKGRLLDCLGVLALTHTNVLRLPCETIVIAPAADGVEVFKSKPRRIHLGVAGSTRGIGTVLLKHLADGDSAGGVRLYGGDVWRRRLTRDSEDPLHDPHTALHGRSRGPIRSDLQYRGLGEQPAARRAGW